MGGESQLAENGPAVVSAPTAEAAIWLADTNVQKGVAIIREAGKSAKPVLPSSNLELDLGFESMERVELLVALERELGAEADEKVVAQVYTVRELVDGILQARGTTSAARPSLPGWDAVLATDPDDPRVLAALNSSRLLTFGWFVFGRFVSLFVRIFFRLRVSVNEKLPQKGPFILSPNHQSCLDRPVVAI